MTEKYHIIDTTLREGEQTPGLLFSLPEKKRILDGLVKIGVTEAEVGISSKLHPCPESLIDYCRTTHPHLKLSLWSRCRKEDIIHASQLAPDILSLSVPVSDMHLQDRLQKNRLWARHTMTASIELARQMGMAVSIGLEDATRSDPHFLMQMAKAAQRHGAARIRIAGNRPVIGDDIFACETGLHLQGLQNKPETYEPFNPEKVQAERKLLFGAKSGRQAMLQHMTQMDTTFSGQLTDGVIQTIRETATRLQRPLSDAELIRLLST